MVSNDHWMMRMVVDGIGWSICQYGEGKTGIVGNDWRFNDDADACEERMGAEMFRYGSSVVIERVRMQMYRKLPSMYRMKEMPS